MYHHRYCNSIIVRVAGVAATVGMMADVAGTITGVTGAVATACKVMVMAVMALALAQVAFVVVAEDRRSAL
jgi:hypothetical protein